jgi:DnaK suppressor protein
VPKTASKRPIRKATSTKASGKKASGKTAPGKKAPGKKASGGRKTTAAGSSRAPVNRSKGARSVAKGTSKKSVAKKAAARKTVAKKSTAKSSAAKKAPGKKTGVKKVEKKVKKAGAAVSRSKAVKSASPAAKAKPVKASGKTSKKAPTTKAAGSPKVGKKAGSKSATTTASKSTTKTTKTTKTAKTAKTTKTAEKSKTSKTAKKTTRRAGGRKEAKPANPRSVIGAAISRSDGEAESNGYVIIKGRRVRMISTKGLTIKKRPRAAAVVEDNGEAEAERIRAIKTKLKAAELQKYREMLLERRQELVGVLNVMEEEALRSRGGNLSNMPLHMADVGSDTYDQDFTLGMAEAERKLLLEIDQALVRIADRTYGVCQMTGKPIPKMRLNAKPWAKYTIEAARLVESGQHR